MTEMLGYRYMMQAILMQPACKELCPLLTRLASATVRNVAMSVSVRECSHPWHVFLSDRAQQYFERSWCSLKSSLTRSNVRARTSALRVDGDVMLGRKKSIPKGTCAISKKPHRCLERLKSYCRYGHLLN